MLAGESCQINSSKLLFEFCTGCRFKPLLSDFDILECVGEMAPLTEYPQHSTMDVVIPVTIRAVFGQSDLFFHPFSMTRSALQPLMGSLQRKFSLVVMFEPP